MTVGPRWLSASIEAASNVGAFGLALYSLAVSVGPHATRQRTMRNGLRRDTFSCLPEPTVPDRAGCATLRDGSSGEAGRALSISMTRIALVAVLAVALWSERADACGCFAPSNTTVSPVVQAGERILFAVRDGKVIAHIHIQYSGDAQE